MQKSNRYYFTIAVALFICSCEKDIDLKIPTEPTKLVVQSVFSPDRPLQISLTESLVTGSRSEFLTVTDASIELFEDNQFIQKLAYESSANGKGFYHSSDQIPKIGSTYKIIVQAEGHPEVHSESKIPSSRPTNLHFQMLGMSGNEFKRFCRVKFEDISSDKNYYHLVLRSRRVDWTVEPGADTVFQESAFTEILLNPTNTDNGDLIQIDSEADFFTSYLGGFRGLLFSDETFNKGTFQLDFEVFHRQGIEAGDQAFQEFDTELRHVSPEYFKYYRSFLLQEENAENPFAEPSFIYNNVEGGLGNFSSYNAVLSNRVSAR